MENNRPKRPKPPQDPPPREQGKHHRFCSLTDLIAHCKTVYQTDRIATQATSGASDLYLVVETPQQEPLFSTLVVHFEGEKTYVAWLPTPQSLREGRSA